MQKAGVFLVLFLLLYGMVSADSTSTRELFVNTDPIGAEVSIGKEKVGHTPLRIGNYEGKSLEIRISKSGYVPLTSRQEVGEERRKLVFFTLAPVDLRLNLDQKGLDVFINGENAGRTPLVINKLPAGTYEIEKSEKGISFSNTSQQALRRATRFETFFTGGLCGTSLAVGIYFGSKGRETESQALGVSTVIFAGLLTYNLLKLMKLNTNYHRDVKKLSAVEVEPLDRKGPLDYFSTGMELVGRESWGEALSSFLRVINIFPDSQVVPISVYEAGYCYYKLEDQQKAVEYFRTFVYNYPIYELFPYGVYYLLESEISGGNAAQALADYNALKPVRLEDPSGVIHKDYFRVLEKLYRETGGESPYILSDLLAEFDDYLAKNPGSTAVPEISLLKGRLLYTYLDKAGGTRMLNDLRQRYRGNKYITDEVEKVLHGR